MMISPETLRRFPIFSHLNHYMLDEVAMISQEEEFKAGEWIFHEKEDARKFYIILEGEVELTLYLYYNGKGQHIRTTSPLGRGELFGWSAVIKPYQYTMGARASADTTLIAIDAEPLKALLDDNPEYGYFFMKNIAELIGERLTFKCIQLLSLVIDKQNTNLEKEEA